MTASPPDHWMASRSDEQLVAGFAVARRRGDATEMERIWRVLIVRFHGRIEHYCRRFAPGGDTRNGLRGPELDDALTRALQRFAFNLVHTFRGTSVGELVNATRQLTSFVCLDVFDERVRAERRTVSADEPARRDDPDGAGRWDAEVAAALRADLERREAAADAVGRVDAAFARLTNPSHRRVLELDRLGVPDPEIAATLDITLDNVYARRSRGLKALRGHLDADA